MSESVIELARIEVQAISVKVRPDPTALERVDELMLQVNADGTVQVDVFGTNSQGNPFHESSAFAEQKYEHFRQALLKKEMAVLPPYSSFRSGNTLGRVVGETAPAAVPASQANPPAVVETEEEESWWSIASPWLHGGLDVAGFIPGLGAVPDIINAGVYIIEGDTESAKVAALAAIPVFGDAVKGGVLVGKAAHKIGAQSGKKAAERTSIEAAERRSSDSALKPASRSTKKPPEKNSDPVLAQAKPTNGGKSKRDRKNDNCKPLENGLPGNAYRGGKHSKIRKGGYKHTPPRESHHMPASSAYSTLNGKPIHSNNMPTIQMDKDDHTKTASWGSSNAATSYRLEQQRQIKTGKAGYMSAMMMDIIDIRSKFGSKYDAAIAQMLAWSKCKGYI